MRLLVVSVVAASLLAISATACSGEEAATGNDSPPAAQTTEDALASKSSAGEISAEDFDRSLFDENSATLDNEWLSFTVGKRFIWSGSTEEEGERIARRIVFTVTDMTKEINGVRALVGWDRDYRAGKLLETELIFLAQDKSGNVWHLGEYAELWDEGQFDGGQAWMVGHLKGAKAGIHMKAEPKLAAPAYSQGFAPAPYFWNDWSKVSKIAKRTCGPKRCWKDVVVIDEFEPNKPGAYQVKYYARGIGNVRIGWRGNDADREALFLDKVVRLGPKAMAEARAAVAAHEERAYVYGSTPRAQRRSG
jgi:hypothetical protein